MAIWIYKCNSISVSGESGHSTRGHIVAILNCIIGLIGFYLIIGSKYAFGERFYPDEFGGSLVDTTWLFSPVASNVPFGARFWCSYAIEIVAMKVAI